MGAAAKGLSGAGIEFINSGMQARLAATPVSGLPASLSTAIPATSVNGERFVAFVWNHTAAGTIAIAGTAPLSGAAVNETSSSIAVAERPGEVMIYVTTSANIFATVNASGVTLGSGLTGGSVALYGIQAATRMLPGEVKLADKVKEHSPLEQRGVFDADFNLLALAVDCGWEYAADYYADVALMALLGGYGAQASLTQTTLPAAPVSLLAATACATAGTASLTTQPTAPGFVLQIALTGTAPTTAATISVTGTNVYGETVTEVVVPSTKVQQTYTSSNIFASVAASGIAFGAFGTGATFTVNGVFGFSLSGNPQDVLNTFALEQYDSTASFVAPYCVVDEWSVEGGAEKEAKIAVKGKAQAVLPVGNPATTTNQITAFAQVIDKPDAGFQSLIFIDPLTGSFGATQNQDLIDWKLTTKLDWEWRWTSWGNPPNRYPHVAYRKRRVVEFEATLDMTSTTFQNEYAAWRQRRKRLLQYKLIGSLMGTSAGTTWNEGATFNLALRWLEGFERDFAPSQASVIAKVKGRAEFEPSLGYAHNYTWYSHIAGW